MDGFELNKIIAAILATVVMVFGINKVTDIIFIPVIGYNLKQLIRTLKKNRINLQNCDLFF